MSKVKSHESKIKEYYNYLTEEKNVPRNITIGILSQIAHESGFDPSSTNTKKTEHRGSYGLFQWMDGPWGNRGTQMINTVGKDWKKDWKGQLDYFLNERKIFKNASDKDIKYNGKTVKAGDNYLSNRTYYNALQAFAKDDSSVRGISGFITDNIIGPGKPGSERRNTQINERANFAEAISDLIGYNTMTMYEANKNFLASGGEVGDAFRYKGKSYRSWSDRGSLSKQDDPLRNYK